jgi:hypothetical protein
LVGPLHIMRVRVLGCPNTLLPPSDARAIKTISSSDPITGLPRLTLMLPSERNFQYSLVKERNTIIPKSDTRFRRHKTLRLRRRGDPIMMLSEEPYAAHNHEIGRLTVLAVADASAPTGLRYMAPRPDWVKSHFQKI